MSFMTFLLGLACMLPRILKRHHRLLANGTVRLASTGSIRGEIIRRGVAANPGSLSRDLAGTKGDAGRFPAAAERSPDRAVRSPSVDERWPRRIGFFTAAASMM
jgi:hypothetical protein